MLNFYFKLFASLKMKDTHFFCFRTLRKDSFIDYNCGTKDRIALEEALGKLSNELSEVPVIIGKEHIFSGDDQLQMMPHNHQLTVSEFHYANLRHIRKSIRKAIRTQEKWRIVDSSEKACIWRRCADILETNDRHILNAATMLGQAKTYLQADLDTCLLVESLRMSADYLAQLSEIKLKSNVPDILYPSFHLRPLDGFVAAVGPFNSTSISANLAFLPALMGNCVVWKPSNNCMLSSFIVYQAMQKAGLPPGVICFTPSNSGLFLQCISKSAHFSGINFTGTVATFRNIWYNIAKNIRAYTSFPRMSAECGGKNFHFVHESADLNNVVKSTISAAFEYSGQNCTSCSRLYVPESMWSDICYCMQKELCSLKVGDPCDFTSFTSAVINEIAFDRIVGYLSYAKKSQDVDVIYGGHHCKTLGYFIEPTILLCKDPYDCLMTEEILGPILSVYVYKDDELDQTLKVVVDGTNYALNGSIFANDDKVICRALTALQMTAGNMYINNECTGHKYGHQKLSGNGISGTNDKPGSAYFLLRWCSPQLVEETFCRDSNDSV